jgi:hypothetical protein
MRQFNKWFYQEKIVNRVGQTVMELRLNIMFSRKKRRAISFILPIRGSTKLLTIERSIFHIRKDEFEAISSCPKLEILKFNCIPFHK